MKTLFILTFSSLFISAFLNSTAQGKSRVAIIGAGLGGTKVAAMLNDSNAEIHLYESEERVGGRSFSKPVTLSNGVSTTVNTGTMFVFDHFLEMAPELNEIEDFYIVPNQSIIIAATGANQSTPSIYSVERNPNLGDTERTKEIGDKIIMSGLFNELEFLLPSVTIFKFNEQHLSTLPFDDLMTIYQRNPEWDNMSAEDFLRELTYAIQPVTMWGDWFTAYSLWQKYQSAPIGPQKAKLAMQILENGLYYGMLMSNGQNKPIPAQQTARFSKAFIKNYINPMEYLVDFTDLSNLSAVHFIWQLKWMYSSGRFISSKNWTRVPEFYLQKNKNVNLHLKNRVEKIQKNSEGKFILTIKTPVETKTEEFDVVINTADTGAVAEMTDFQAPELKRLLNFNNYTATIALFIEADKTARNIFGFQHLGSALAASQEIFETLGGVTFQTEMYRDDLDGHEIIGLFAKTDAAKKILEKSESKNWTEAELAEKVKTAFVDDLRGLEESSGSPQFKRLREAVERGSILFTVPWANALPSFEPGYMKRVAEYRKVMGADGYFYLGQALYGRSAVMVIAGVDRDIKLIKQKLTP